MSTAGLLPNVVNPPPIPNPITGLFTGNFRNFPNADSIAQYFNITFMPMFASMLMGQKYSPRTTGYIHKEYDYVIVGAGAAGCVLGNRLSDNPNVTVSVLEAGLPPPILTEFPGLARGLLILDTNYNYYSERQKFSAQQLHENRYPYSAGKGIGGSSLINAMIYIRGHCENYDEWAEMGATNWSCKDVKPFFLLLENNTDLDFLQNGCHSTGGPLTASKPQHVSKMRPVLLEAAESRGWKINVDPNCGSQDGISDHQTFTRNGQRCSAAKAYLVPVDGRPNLHIAQQAVVTKIHINPETMTAEGVYFDWRKKEATHYVKARRQVIITAGALNTPKLLMLSGIGPKEDLEKHKIPVLVDSPVGKNFQDHFTTILFYYLEQSLSSIKLPYLVQLIQPLSIAEYLANRSGPIASPTGIYAIGFGFNPNRSSNGSHDPDIPDYEAYFIEGENAAVRLTFGLKPWVYEKLFFPYELKPTLWCMSSTTKPKDRGYVGLHSNNAYDPPKIDPNFLKEEKDLKDVVAGMKACQEFANTPAMRKAGVRPFKTKMPGCEKYSEDTDEYFGCYAKSFGFTIGHQSCTAKMGSESDPTAVLTPDLSVKGVKNLKVADASVMPTVVSGNTMVPVLMIAEKAAHMFKQEEQRGT